MIRLDKTSRKILKRFYKRDNWTKEQWEEVYDNAIYNALYALTQTRLFSIQQRVINCKHFMNLRKIAYQKMQNL